MYNKFYLLSIQNTEVLNTVGDRWTVLRDLKKNFVTLKFSLHNKWN